jgi:hypothetical protein
VSKVKANEDYGHSGIFDRLMSMDKDISREQSIFLGKSKIADNLAKLPQGQTIMVYCYNRTNGPVRLSLSLM